VLVAIALADNAGFYGPGPLATVTVALGLAVAAARGARRADTPVSGGGVVGPLLAVAVAGFLGYGVVKRPTAVPPWLFALAALGLAADLPPVGRAAPWLRRARLPLWLACGAAMAIATVRTEHGDWIDVWSFQQEAVGALVRGEDPYRIEYRNVYGDLRYYGPGVADAERVHAFPYPPQTILLDLPAVLGFGDVRTTMVAALLAAALALALLAPAGLRGLAAAALLFHPKTLSLMKGAWTEPTVLAAVLLLLLALRRLARAPPRGWIAAGLAGALLAGAKQYSPILLLPLVPAVPAPARRRTVALAAAVTAALFVPFLLWDARGLWNGVVAMQVLQPFRTDSLSWLVVAARLGVGAPPAAAFLCAAVALALTWPRGGSLPAAAASAAATFLAFLLCAKQAFLNYYWLADALLLAAALLLAGGAEGTRPSCWPTTRGIRSRSFQL
jgi:hypothetical protein